MNTRSNYIKWWNECLDYLKKDFPHYYELIKEYKLQFTLSKAFFGRCFYGTLFKIELSEVTCKNMTEKDVKDTILHEFAHAIDAKIRGYSDHQKEWKLIAREIGATPAARSKVIKGIKRKYVCVLEKGNKELELQFCFDVKRDRHPFNEKIKDLYIKNKKHTTIHKLKYLHWADWEVYCDNNDLSPFLEDWI